MKVVMSAVIARFYFTRYIDNILGAGKRIDRFIDGLCTLILR